MDGVFVGTHRLPKIAEGEDHELGFGADDGIRVVRAEIRRKKGEAGLITSSKTDERNFKITVSNHHDRTLPIEVIDQIPYAEDEKISITTLKATTPPSRRDIGR